MLSKYTRFLFIILFCTLFFTTNSAIADKKKKEEEKQPGHTVEISPPRVVLNPEPGDAPNGIIKITNRSYVPMQTTTDLVDWGIRSTAKGNSISFLPLGSNKKSCANWIQIIPSEATIEPGQTQEFSYVMTTPPDIEGGYYAAILFVSEFLTDIESSKDEKSKKVQMGLRTKACLPSVFYAEIKGTAKPKIEVTEFGISEPNDNLPVQVRYKIQNQGNVYVRAEGNFHIADKVGKVYGTGKLGSIITQPGDQGEATTIWGGQLPEGDYDLVFTIILEPLSKDIVVKVKSFKVKSSGTISSVEFEKKKKNLVVEYTNDGNISYPIKGICSILQNKKIVKTLSFDRDHVGAKETEIVRLDVSSLQKGNYLIKTQVQFNDKKTTKESNIIIR